MNEQEYIEARIAEINHELSKKHLRKKYRINQQKALEFYKEELFKCIITEE